MDDLRQVFADGLRVSANSILLAPGTEHPECLCGIVLQDEILPSDMVTMLDRVLPSGNLTRACVQLIPAKYADGFRDIAFDIAWDLAWDFASVTVRYGEGESPMETT